jgi:hypothetical protein
VRRQHHQGALRLVDGLLHGQHEVLTLLKIPGLHHHRVAGRLELPGDPFGGGPVVLVVADKELFHDRDLGAGIRSCRPQDLRYSAPMEFAGVSGKACSFVHRKWPQCPVGAEFAERRLRAAGAADLVAPPPAAPARILAHDRHLR